MIGFGGLRVKTCSYLRNDSSEDKKAKGRKVCHKIKIKFEDYKNCLEATQLEDKINHLKKIKLTYIVLKMYNVLLKKLIRLL